MKGQHSHPELLVVEQTWEQPPYHHLLMQINNMIECNFIAYTIILKFKTLYQFSVFVRHEHIMIKCILLYYKLAES